MTQSPPVWTIRNKIDLVPAGPISANGPVHTRSESTFRNEQIIIPISAERGTGISDLFQALGSYVERFFGSESGLITRERHRVNLEDARAALTRALAAPLDNEEIIAEELRLAARSLGRVTGKVDVEDILDVIFRDFCIGK